MLQPITAKYVHMKQNDHNQSSSTEGYAGGGFVGVRANPPIDRLACITHLISALVFHASTVFIVSNFK